MDTPEIQIACFQGTSLLSRAIKWQTRSRYSHTALRIKGTREVIEAWHPGGVRRGPIDNGHTPGTIVDIYDVNWGVGMALAKDVHADVAYAHEGVLDFATQQIGGAYAFRSVLRFMTRKPASHRPGVWFCSELAIESFRRGANIDLLRRIPSEHVSPGVLSYSPLLWHTETIVTREPVYT